MFFRLYVFLIVFLVGCAKSGSLSGNVFSGNRPDAGAEVFLYSIKDSMRFDGKADVQGNYSIDQIPEGEYLLITQSKSITTNAFDAYRELYVNTASLERVYRVDLSKLLDDSIHKQMSALYKTDRDSINKVVATLLDKLPPRVALETGAYSEIPNRFRIESIKIEKDKKVVTDFTL